MSGIKRFAEQQEAERELVAALEALIQYKELEGAALGIAKKVISDNGTKNLSDKQKYVYEKEIKSKFEMACEDEDCGNMIRFSEMPMALANRYGGEDALCDECQYREHSIARAIARDD